MADRDFQMKEELMLIFCTFSVPSGATVNAQMTTTECKTTKDVANVANVANNSRRTSHQQNKNFPDFKVNIATILHNIDDIVKTCVTLCSLKP